MYLYIASCKKRPKMAATYVFITLLVIMASINTAESTPCLTPPACVSYSSGSALSYSFCNYGEGIIRFTCCYLDISGTLINLEFNGVGRQSLYQPNSFLTMGVHCDDSGVFNQTTYISCLVNGTKAIESTYSCLFGEEKITTDFCPSPLAPDNELISQMQFGNDSTPYLARVDLYCDASSYLVGTGTMTCTKDGIYSYHGDIPTCMPIEQNQGGVAAWVIILLIGIPVAVSFVLERVIGVTLIITAFTKYSKSGNQEFPIRAPSNNEQPLVGNAINNEGTGDEGEGNGDEGEGSGDEDNRSNRFGQAVPVANDSSTSTVVSEARRTRVKHSPKNNLDRVNSFDSGESPPEHSTSSECFSAPLNGEKSSGPVSETESPLELKDLQDQHRGLTAQNHSQSGYSKEGASRAVYLVPPSKDMKGSTSNEHTHVTPPHVETDDPPPCESKLDSDIVGIFLDDSVSPVDSSVTMETLHQTTPPTSASAVETVTKL